MHVGYCLVMKGFLRWIAMHGILYESKVGFRGMGAMSSLCAFGEVKCLLR